MRFRDLKPVDCGSGRDVLHPVDIGVRRVSARGTDKAVLLRAIRSASPGAPVEDRARFPPPASAVGFMTKALRARPGPLGWGSLYPILAEHGLTGC